MKIAAPVTSANQIDSHFGHCEFYNIYTISDSNEIIDIQRLDSPQGCGCKSSIAVTLASHGVTVMLAGGIGNGAISVLAKEGISVIRGCSGVPRDLVSLYVRGELSDSGSSCSSHGHDHVCSQ